MDYTPFINIVSQHLFKAARAELALHFPPFVYLGKRNISPDLTGAESACAAPDQEAPIRGTLRSLACVLRLRHSLGLIIMCGVGPSRTTSLLSSPQASANLVPVSLIKAISHLRSSSNSKQMDWISLTVAWGIG